MKTLFWRAGCLLAMAVGLLLFLVLLLISANVHAQTTDPTAEEFSAAVTVMTRYLEAVRRTQQTETADIKAIQDGLLQLINVTNKRLDALEAAQKRQPQVRLQAITVAVPADPP